MKTETEFSIRLLNSKSNTNTAFTKPYRALPMTVRTKIHQAALDREDSFREGDTTLRSLLLSFHAPCRMELGRTLRV